MESGSTSSDDSDSSSWLGDQNQDEMKLVVDDERMMNFLSNHSSQRLSMFLCKALAPALVTLLALYSWLPLLYIDVKET